jgi:hypothetical protein
VIALSMCGIVRCRTSGETRSEKITLHAVTQCGTQMRIKNPTVTCGGVFEMSSLSPTVEEVYVV